jgi:hypothetical protein
LRPIRSPDRASAPGFLFPARQRRCKDGVKEKDMQRHFDDTTEMYSGAKRPCDTIALGEDCTRASEAKEIC